MGGNLSKTRQKLETSINNQTDINFSVDQSTNCDMAADASQTMEDIRISGSANIELKQVQDIQNLCYAQSVAKLGAFNQLAADVQNDILQSMQQEGGIGINVSDTNVEAITKIKNETGVDMELDATKKCLAQVSLPQFMGGITIEDSKNVNLSQEASNFNKCMFDTAADIAQETGIDLESKTDVEQQVSQKGWDPIASIGGLFGSAALLALAPAIMSIVVIILSSVIGGGAAASGQGGPQGEIPPPPPGAGQMGGALSKFLGVRSRKGKGLIVLLIRVSLVVGVAWLLYKLLTSGRSSNESFYGSSMSGDAGRGYQRKPLALRHQYHHPHISEDMYPQTNEIPHYVKRWW